MKRFELKAALNKMKRLPSWVLVIALVAGVLLEATFLRNNHLDMNKLREEVLAADESGNDEEIQNALTNLKNFARTHMIINVVEKNGISSITFGTGPIYLEHQYVRKASQVLEEASANAADDSNPNGNVFAKAMDVCKPQAIANGWSWNSQEHIDCMMGEIAKYPASDFIADNSSVNLPSTGLFRYDFTSPIWTFSLEGIILLVCLVLIAVLIIRLCAWIVIRVALLFVKK